MTLEEFITALYDSGWAAPNDAQHAHIKNVFESLIGERNTLLKVISTCNYALAVAIKANKCGWLQDAAQQDAQNILREFNALP